MTPSETHKTRKPQTSDVAAGVSDLAINLANFWPHQLHRVKERAEDLKRPEGQSNRGDNDNDDTDASW